MTVPRYSYNELAAAAGSFLQQRHPSRACPVPIEEIVELKLRLDIVPTPNLQADFDTVGFTSSDLSAIYVDDFVYRKRPARYRFTLAHEVGHIVLHSSLYQSRTFDSIAEWKQVISSIEDEDYGWMEWHANAFAGLVLVPPATLRAQTALCLKRVQEHAPSAKEEPEAYREFVELCLSQAFEVSTEVIAKRMEKDGIRLT
jgi:hypothetical protein